MMKINKYEVITRIGCDEFCDYAGQDIKEALRVARQFKDQNAELRTNIDEVDGGLNYDTIAFRIFVSIAETCDLLEECDSVEEAERHIQELEEQDRDEGTYAPGYYAIVDEDGCSYWEHLGDMTEEQDTADRVGIRKMREYTGLNRKAFCDKYGIPYRTMQDWEDGKSKPVAWAEGLLRRAVAEDFPG